METSTLITLLTTHYSLPALCAITPVTTGYLSRNWTVTTVAQRYFLKEYRFQGIDRVQAAHASLLHFHSCGIPTIVPVKTQHNQTICEHEGRFYALFPYVEGRALQRGALPKRAVQAVGAMLARLHRAGDDCCPPHVRQRLPKDDRRAFKAGAVTILALIAQQERKTAFDRLAQQTLERQLALVAQTEMDYASLTLQSDHLLHGDYHDGNLFFDEQDQVRYLFDWEKTEVAPREVELIRALLFTCFSNPHNFCGTFTSQNFALGTAFLTAYQEAYAVDHAGLVDALRVRYWGSLCSLWVPTEHYLHQNHRVDLFLEAQLTEINYFAAHLDSFANWLNTVSP